MRVLLFRVAIAVLALHVLDDNFVQPEPATAPSGHLVSGLIPVLLLAPTAAASPACVPGAGRWSR